MRKEPVLKSDPGSVVRPEHGRALGILGVSVTKARLPKGCEGALASVRDQLEEVMLRTGYLQGAAFSWVTIAIRFGLVNALEPTYSAINLRHGDLPLSIEIDISPLQGRSLEEYRAAYLRAAARALFCAGRKNECSSVSLRTLSKLAESAPGSESRRDAV